MDFGRLSLTVAAALAVGVALPAAAQQANTGEAQAKAPASKELAPGDDAPAIKVASWLKGKPVERFEKGNVYIVEFWATWCGPCRTAIPHLTELQKKHAGDKLHVVGVSIWENDGVDPVREFVEKMGDKMDYSVAYGGDPRGGEMEQTWMRAAGRNGIPSSFVVDKDGKVAFIGHPMELDKKLPAILAGKHDIAAEAKAYKDARAAERERAEKRKAGRSEVEKAFDAMVAAAQAEKYDEAVKQADRVIGLKPDGMQAAQAAQLKFQLLLHERKDAKAAYAFARETAEGPTKTNAALLNAVAWSIIDPEAKIENPDFDTALKVAKAANEAAEGKDASILDTYALALFKKGEVSEAIKHQEKAIQLADDPGLREELEGRLNEFKSAKK